MSLLNGLNEAQHRAVISDSKVILCLAGAGTGKTRVLTHRIAYLNDEYRVGTSNMLALTFTRLAGKEMKERLMKLVGESEGQKLFCNTFHAFCVKVLKEYGHRIGLEPNFMIYDQADRDSIIKKIISEYHYQTTLQKVLDVYESGEIETSEEMNVVNELDYRMKQNNAVDLDGLLNKTMILLESHPDVAEHYRNQYKYVYVDEFQDTSVVQMKIIQLINPDNLFVVGDDFQAIYGWRGAEVRNILDFPSHYPECETIKLTRNYRSTVPIVDASNKLIKHNEEQSEKELETDVEGITVRLNQFENEYEEAEAIVSEIANRQNVNLSDIAILARTNRQLDFMNKRLREQDIPCLLLSNRGDPLKDNIVQMVIGYMELVVNPKESWKIKRLVNFPEPRIRPLQIEEIELYCIENDATYLEAIDHFKDKITPLQSFLHVIDKLKNEVNFYDMDAQTAFRAVVHTLGIIPMYQEQGLDNRIQTLAMARDKIGRWVQLQKSLGESDSPEAFLRWMITKDIQEKLMDDMDAVRLMTVHGSKGLEFDHVYVIGMNEGVFPSLRGDISEERRLMYVASTRAKKQLVVTRAQSTKSYSGGEESRDISRFIGEMGII